MPWSYCRGRRAGRVRLVGGYELNDEFLTPDPNPLGSQPRICEPGPGVLQWRDLDGRLSVNFGALQLAGASASWDRTFLHCEFLTFSRKAGRYLEFEWTPQNVDYTRAGWQRGSTGFIGDNLAMLYFSGSGNIEVIDDQDVVSPAFPYVTLSESYLGRVYDTGESFYYYVQERSSNPGHWYLLWRKELSPSRLNTIRPAFQNIAQQGTMQFLRIRTGRLPPPQALIRQPAANEDACGAAEGLFEVLLASPAAGSPGLVFRKSDASNYWKLVVNRAANTVDLVKVVAGTPTTVGSVALTLAVNTELRLRALCFKDRIRTWLGLTPVAAVTDSFNQTAAVIGTLSDATYRELRCDASGAISD